MTISDLPVFISTHKISESYFSDFVSLVPLRWGVNNQLGGSFAVSQCQPTIIYKLMRKCNSSLEKPAAIIQTFAEQEDQDTQPLQHSWSHTIRC